MVSFGMLPTGWPHLAYLSPCSPTISGRARAKNSPLFLPKFLNSMHDKNIFAMRHLEGRNMIFHDTI